MIFVYFLFLALPTFVVGTGFKLFFGGSGDDICERLVVEANGNFAVGGSTTSWGTSGGTKDILIAKFLSNGTMNYINSFGTSGEDTMSDMIISSDGNYVYVGRGRDPTIRETIVKIDSLSGSLIWDYFVDVVSSHYYTSVIEGGDGLFYVGGYYTGDYMMTVSDHDSDGTYTGFFPNRYWHYDDLSGLRTYAVRVLSLNSTHGLLIGYREADGASNKDPVFGIFEFSKDGRDLQYYYYVGDDTAWEKTTSAILISSTRLILIANDDNNNCFVIYNVNLPPSTVSADGIRVCHSSHEIYGYDIVRTADNNFVVVGKAVVGSTDYGLIVKIDDDCESVLFAQYFSDTEQLNAAKIQNFPDVGRIIVSGVTSDRCVVVKLESDDQSVFGCLPKDSTSVDISSGIFTVERNKTTSQTHSDDDESVCCDNQGSLSMSEVASPVLGENKTCPYSGIIVWTCGGIPYTSDEVCNFKNGSCESQDFCNCTSTLYEGKDCEEWRCNGTFSNESDIVCSGHGDCIEPEICVCDDEYFDPFCDVTTCFGVLSNDTEKVCSGRGECVDFGVCRCEEDYYGGSCNITRCHGVLSNSSSVCSSHALSCWPFDHCRCEQDYYGIDCNITSCGGEYSNDSSTVCSGHGRCISLDYCDCDGDGDDYYGSICQNFTCFGLLMNETGEVCGGHGECIELDVCECQANYSGYASDCSIFECFSILSNDSMSSYCSGHGNCSGYDFCECQNNYTTYDCSMWYCNSTSRYEIGEVCSGGRGNCSRPDHCDCINGYTGDFCEQYECYDVSSKEVDEVCSGHGSCVSSNNCSCETNYTILEDCSLWECFSVLNSEENNDIICSGHGNCTSYDICECSQNYTSSDCSDYFCFGVDFSSSSTVCSGHGECTAPDVCECEDDSEFYSGDQCEYFECWGIGANVTEGCDEGVECVCSGHGDCIGYNNCSCMELYPGYDCGSFECYGIVSTELDHSCGFNHTKGNYGLCVDVDTCFCFPGYSSLFLNGPCTEWYCGNVHRMDTENVCSGRGDCEKAQECTCRDGYEGLYCDTWSCGADYKMVDLTCSGNGVCLGPDNCDCDGGFVGKHCEENTLYYYVMAPILSVFGTGSLLLILSLLCCVCMTCVCFVFAIFLGCGCVLVLGISTITLRERMRKFGKLEDFDLLLREQQLEKDSSIAHLKINTELFQIPFTEIKIEQILGEGGSNSIVFKVLWKNQVCAFESFDEFEREVEILASVSHPNIISFFGASMKPPRVGIVMEYCEHGDLDRFLYYFYDKYEMDYPIKEKIRMISEISHACEYLHSRKIIHRDLKMENVLVDSHLSCKLMDFGLSRMVERMSQQKTLKIGTNIYMSPEIVLGTGTYTPSVDVFSFAILVFILVTENRFPYGEDNSFGNVEFKIANNPNFRPSVDEMKESCGSGGNNVEEYEWLIELVSVCWKHEPEERWDFEKISGIIFDNFGKENNMGKKKVNITFTNNGSSMVTPRIEGESGSDDEEEEEEDDDENEKEEERQTMENMDDSKQEEEEVEEQRKEVEEEEEEDKDEVIMRMRRREDEYKDTIEGLEKKIKKLEGLLKDKNVDNK